MLGHASRHALVVLVLAVVLTACGAAPLAMTRQAAPARPAPAWLDRPEQPAVPIGRVVGATVLVLALLCFAVYAAKRLRGGGLLRGPGHLDVIESRVLGRGVALHLVRVGERAVLLGVTGENMARLAEFAAAELPEPQAEPEPAVRRSFEGLLRSLAGAHR